jgi:hypothetical protein
LNFADGGLAPIPEFFHDLKFELRQFGRRHPLLQQVL